MTGFFIARSIADGSRVELIGASAAIFSNYDDARKSCAELARKYPQQRFCVAQGVLEMSHSLNLHEAAIGVVREPVARRMSREVAE